MKIIIIYLLVIAAALGIGFWLYKSSQTSQSSENKPGQAFENVGRNHIQPGEKPSVPYNSNPPTSGDHWGNPANWGIYKAIQPDEQLVHNLEHGGIWISYKPSVDKDTIARLEDFAKRWQLIIVEPREADDAPISFAAWQHLENFQSFDEGEMIKFINAYYDQGPEKVSM